MSNKKQKDVSGKEVNNIKYSNLYDVNQIVLPWEIMDDFDKHRQACRETFNPEGQFQEEEVLEIARLYWVKRRNNVGYHKSYFKDLPATLLREAERKGPEAVRALVENQASLQLQARDKLWAMATENSEARNKAASLLLKVATEGQDKQKLTAAQVEDLKLTLELYNKTSESLAPLLKEMGQANPESERHNRFEAIEKSSKINAEIDRQIDKRIARLVNLKEYARMYGKGGTHEAFIDVSPTKIAKKNS